MRSKNVPRKSVHLVEEIIEKFRSGEQDTADFWINKPGLFIYIHYVAVRDEDGTFRGVLEMMQDCTKIRALEDSRTLLTWDNEKKTADPAQAESKAAPADKGNAEPASKTEAEPASQTDAEPAPEPKPQLSPAEIVKNLSAETRLQDLLTVFPWLKEELPTINPAFKMLNTPLARVMIPHATVLMMSARSEMPLDELITKLKALIEAKSAE